MPINVTFLEQDKQTPAQVAAQLADFLNAAKTSLHVAIYDFRLSDATAGPVVQALQGRAAAGVDVRIAYDAGKPNADFPGSGADPAPPGTADFVRRLGDKIQSKPITGGDPQLPKLMHQKYVVRDGGTPAAAVWTGSTNFTDDSWSLQENNIVRLDSPELAAYYETDFRELWERGDIATTGAHDAGTVSVGGAAVKVAFSPGEGRAIDQDVAHLVRGARRRLAGLLHAADLRRHPAGAAARARPAGLEFGGVYDATQMAGVKRPVAGRPVGVEDPRVRGRGGPAGRQALAAVQPDEQTRLHAQQGRGGRRRGDDGELQPVAQRGAERGEHPDNPRLGACEPLCRVH